jgi:hypothetical protein
MRTVAAVWVLGCLTPGRSKPMARDLHSGAAMHIDRRLLVGFACLVCSPGCTLAGAGIGALVSVTRDPVYEERSVEKIRQGDRVSISASGEGQVEGRYAGAVAPTPLDPRLVLVVDRDGNGTLQPIPTSEIESMKVDAADRKWWIYGGLIGMCVDAIALGVVSATFGHMGDMK